MPTTNASHTYNLKFPRKLTKHGLPSMVKLLFLTSQIQNIITSVSSTYNQHKKVGYFKKKVGYFTWFVLY